MRKAILTIMTILFLNSCVPLLLVGTGAAVGAITYDCVSENGKCKKIIENKKSENKQIEDKK